MNHTRIPWTDYTWNPVTGCTPASEGCQNCYCRAMEKRFKWLTAVTLHHERLEEPLHQKRSGKVFVCSMSDLFHEDVPDRFIEAVFGVMAITPHITYQVLTKRPERAKEWFAKTSHGFCVAEVPALLGALDEHKRTYRRVLDQIGPGWPWPLPNVWFGVTAENQARADERIPLLLQVPAEVHFVSIEPMLGPVNLVGLRCGEVFDGEGAPYYNALIGCSYWPDGDYGIGGPALDWVILGGENGPAARRMDPYGALAVADHCGAADVPFFFKGSGSVFEREVAGGALDLCRRINRQEFPEVRACTTR